MFKKVIFSGVREGGVVVDGEHAYRRKGGGWDGGLKAGKLGKGITFIALRNGALDGTV